jgi:hypothetical protein
VGAGRYHRLLPYGRLVFKEFQNFGLRIYNETEVKDLPIYISWPVIYSRFEELLKGF